MIQKLSDRNKAFETAFIVLQQNFGSSILLVCIFVIILFNIYMYIYCIVLYCIVLVPRTLEWSWRVFGGPWTTLCEPYVTRACTVNRVVRASSVAAVCQGREVYQWRTWYILTRTHTYIGAHTHTYLHTHTFIHTLHILHTLRTHIHTLQTYITYTYIHTLHAYLPTYIHSYIPTCEDSLATPLVVISCTVSVFTLVYWIVP